jgi:hypothetical protein
MKLGIGGVVVEGGDVVPVGIGGLVEVVGSEETGEIVGGVALAGLAGLIEGEVFGPAAVGTWKERMFSAVRRASGVL